MRNLIAVALAFGLAGCASSTSNRALVSYAGGTNAYVLDGIELRGVRLGAESAAREWQRPTENEAVARDSDTQLRDRLAADLGRELSLRPTARMHLRIALTLQDTADFEGLAAETADVTLSATITDDHGVVQRTITLREPASAPLQRSKSERTRLDGALDRLSHRLAQQL
ncbi:MAG TPA: hypothetical protein VIA18_28105 [Polyangia bacterium]|nr:hypothetical protein [Polyangia bacterium]